MANVPCEGGVYFLEFKSWTTWDAALLKWKKGKRMKNILLWSLRGITGFHKGGLVSLGSYQFMKRQREHICLIVPQTKRSPFRPKPRRLQGEGLQTRPWQRGWSITMIKAYLFSSLPIFLPFYTHTNDHKLVFNYWMSKGIYICFIHSITTINKAE